MLDSDIPVDSGTVIADAVVYRPDVAAKKASVSRSTIFNAVRDGELTARTRGRVTLIEAAELLRWIRSMPARGRMPEREAAA